MKTILSLAAGLLLAIPATAQIPRVGIEAGVNFSNTTFGYDRSPLGGGDGDDNGDYRAGLKLGAFLDYRLSRGFYFQPGLYISQKGSEEVFNNARLPLSAERNIRINYLEVPFNFLLKAGTGRTGRFFIGAGPYIGVAVGGEYEVNGDEEDLEIGDDNGDLIQRLDAGLNATTGYEFPGGILLRGNVALGLANNLSEDTQDFIEFVGYDDPTLRNTTFSVTLGYIFGR